MKKCSVALVTALSVSKVFIDNNMFSLKMSSAQIGQLEGVYKRAKLDFLALSCSILTRCIL